MDYKKLFEIILSQYTLPLNGLHGVSHWARVLENGRYLSSLTGAKKEVVELFAIFHDSKRENERLDLDHGLRGAKFAALMRKEFFNLSDNDFDLLYTACARHTDGLTEGDITVQTCWDADRLDIGRALIKPDIKYLCTDAAKNTLLIEMAFKRSCKRFAPELINTEWGCNIDLSYSLLGSYSTMAFTKISSVSNNRILNNIIRLLWRKINHIGA